MGGGDAWIGTALNVKDRGKRRPAWLARNRGGLVLMRKLANRIRNAARDGGKHKNYLTRIWRVLFGSALGQIVLIAISPILSRVYDPADFGVLAFYLSVFGVAAVVSSLRLELAIPNAKSGLDASRLTLLAALSGFGLAMVSMPAAFVWHIIGPPSQAGLTAYWWAIPLGIFLMGTSNALTAWGTYYRMYKVVGRSRLMQSVESASIQLLWPLIGTGPAGLIVGSVSAQAGGFYRLGARFYTLVRRRPAIRQWSGLMDNLHHARRYPLVAMPASLIGRIAINAPAPLILWLFGAEVAGLILITQRVIGLPTTILGRAAATPFLQAMADARKRGQSALNVFLLTLGLFSVPGLIMVFGIIIAGPAVFDFVLGDEWRKAGVYAQILAPMYFFQLIASPFTQAQSVAGRQGRQFVVEISRLVLVVGTFLVAKAASASIMVTLAGYSVVMCVVYGMYIVGAAASSLASLPTVDKLQ